MQQNQSGNSKELKFGHGSGATGRDSRYWDKDDRRRDHDYNEEDVLGQNIEKKDEISGAHEDRVREKSETEGGLYNEGGRAELDSYKERYEASLENGRHERRDEEIGTDDDYDDGIDVQDDVQDDHDDEEQGNGDGIESKVGDGSGEETRKDEKLDVKKNSSSEVSKNGNGGQSGGKDAKSSKTGKSSKSKSKPKRHKSGEIWYNLQFIAFKILS